MKLLNGTCLPCIIAVALALPGCGQQESKSPQSTPTNASAHDHADDHAHASGHHGEPIELGTTTIGEFTVRAARDEGDIRPGGDAPIDVWVTGDISKITAIRFWIGVADASGSVKAKAEIENPATPNHWHTHAEIPDPLPAGSQLWVELDIQGRGKIAGAFDLHQS